MSCTIKLLLVICALWACVDALEEADSKQIYSFSQNGFGNDGSSGSFGQFSISPTGHQSSQYYTQENAASSYAPQGGKYKNRSPASGSNNKQPPKNKYGSSNNKPKKDFKPNTRTSIIYGRKFAESLGLLR